MRTSKDTYTTFIAIGLVYAFVFGMFIPPCESVCTERWAMHSWYGFGLMTYGTLRILIEKSKGYSEITDFEYFITLIISVVGIGFYSFILSLID